MIELIQETEDKTNRLNELIENLTKNQKDKIRCGDNGIFRGSPITFQQSYLAWVVRGMSDTQLYKQSGNAVSPPIISQIANALKEIIDE